MHDDVCGVGLYKLFGDIGGQIQAAIDAQKKGMEHFDTDEETGFSESDEDEPFLRPDLPMAYEIQIRGVKRTPPCIATCLSFRQHLVFVWQEPGK